ncbi:MAG: HAMP domain-containing histidine kinase [Prochlorococcus sp.]|nr:HAMP domain-containing histidine kinase [Prochlorococcus sp.]CAI8161382.1 MAG: Sensor protein CreC [Prochlorococcus marinus str. MIT 9215]
MVNSPIPLTAIQQRLAENVATGMVDEQTVRRLWWAALETLQLDILLPMDVQEGVWLAAPLPALYEPRLLTCLQGWVWAPDALESLHSHQASLLPPSSIRSRQEASREKAGRYQRLPLRPSDGQDPLLIIITPEVQVALALQGQPGERHLLMRSDPESLSDILRMLDLRLNQEDPEQAQELRQALASLGPLQGNDQLEHRFWPRIAERLASMAPSLTLQQLPEKSLNAEQKEESKEEPTEELSLLEALTHEVRTPLATIRTLIRSLLRRSDLPHVVVNRLEQIDTECTEQIDRFGLIFHAAELQRHPPETSTLARTDLGSMLKILRPALSQQLERRGVQLHLDISPGLPPVLSDPGRLESMLGGLIDRSSRNLSSGGLLTLKLRPAGQRLKLQILSKGSSGLDQGGPETSNNAELGTVLSWNPNTGSLQLSRAATKRILASLGGRLTQRRDSGITVFFPIAEGNR